MIKDTNVASTAMPVEFGQERADEWREKAKAAHFFNRPIAEMSAADLLAVIGFTISQEELFAKLPSQNASAVRLPLPTLPTMSNRINLINVSRLVDAGFGEDEANFITENREVCPHCPHLLLFHKLDRDEDYELCQLDCRCQSVQFQIAAEAKGSQK